MENKKSSSGTGVSFGIILFIVFLILKLTHVIDWNWWWIFSPIWLPIIIVLIINIILGFVNND
jgi:hypothetical protein